MTCTYARLRFRRSEWALRTYACVLAGLGPYSAWRRNGAGLGAAPHGGGRLGVRRSRPQTSRMHFGAVAGDVSHTLRAGSRGHPWHVP